MSITKPSMIMAFLALFVCMSSAVMAAGTLDPGQPLNCTILKETCKSLADASYGKNASYSGINARCNVTNLSNAKPLCGVNVVCTATFLFEVSTNPNPIPVPTVTTAAPAATPSTNGTAPAPVPTTKPPNGMYTIGAVDMTPQLLEQYDQGKCPTSAANAKVASSVLAMMVIASIASFMSAML
ncbi:hypothetical protein BGZ95_007206 [Linnemannia exigua]|uniref:Elicitin-like protein n=1 Tax=Linnemannia exigua TaxID=604196 RepID=A0AAD4H942_9FUNG|nr:hypothetical protein BGZ95_007206 [Linnemannia exigua]